MLAAAGIPLVAAAARMSLAVPRAAGTQLEFVEAGHRSLAVGRLQAAGMSVVAAGM